jgi:pimeloyl-ACP methyl ester carboxylesterase
MSTRIPFPSRRRKSRWRWLKWLLQGIVGLVLLVLLCGTAYEFWSRAQAVHRYPAPGKLVDIGGRKLQIDCRGSGSPTVVFEAGLGPDGALTWAMVHDEIAKTTRACAYSRAGIMWSDPHAGPQNGATVASDLHTLLAKAGEQPPFVLVGHSLGGPYSMIYTKNYGDQVAGLVFVDASHPDQIQRFEAANIGNQKDAKEESETMALAAKLTWSGLVRLAAPSMMPSPARQPTPATEAVQEEVLSFVPTSLDALLKEFTALQDTLTEAGQLRQLGNRPLVVLTSSMDYSDEVLKQLGKTREQIGKMAAIWLELHNDEATWSSRSEHEVFKDATHYIQFDRPDAVIAAVNKVVAQVREPPQ